MALRPVFIPKYSGNALVDTDMTDFEWVPGLSKTQKIKNVINLHEAFSKKNKFPLEKILEVSSKSVNPMGNELSAFNLYIFNESLNRKISVESAYQGSKVFENGGPFVEIYEKTSIDSKRDDRLKKSGKIIKFIYNNIEWDIQPENAFYNYLYISALVCNEYYYQSLTDYQAFTDIEFNPKKSINCQAYAIAMYLSMKNRGILDKAMKNRDSFLNITGKYDVINSKINTTEQSSLF